MITYKKDTYSFFLQIFLYYRLLRVKKLTDFAGHKAGLIFAVGVRISHGCNTFIEIILTHNEAQQNYILYCIAKVLDTIV